jgi:hypothetical protein
LVGGAAVASPISVSVLASQGPRQLWRDHQLFVPQVWQSQPSAVFSSGHFVYVGRFHAQEDLER